jgi:hypothetical protein
MKRSVVISILLLGGAVSGPAQSVELKGFVRLAGENWACFTRPNEPDQPGFMLTEGETKHGVKLVSVEFAKGVVVVEDQGANRTLRLRSAATAFPATVLGIGPRVEGGVVFPGHVGENVAGLSLGEQYQMMAGNPGWGTIPAASPHAPGAASTGSGQSSGSATTPSTGQSLGSGQAGSTSLANSGAASTTGSADPSGEEWYQESQNIEASRLETANDVLMGNATALPRTPLTPVGTDSRLIGRETFFGSHIPNYIPPGFVND